LRIRRSRHFIIRDRIISLMQELREPADELEMLVDKDLWAYPDIRGSYVRGLTGTGTHTVLKRQKTQVSCLFLMRMKRLTRILCDIHNLALNW
jgi:hypothetical protein